MQLLWYLAWYTNCCSTLELFIESRGRILNALFGTIHNDVVALKDTWSFKSLWTSLLRMRWAPTWRSQHRRYQGSFYTYHSIWTVITIQSLILLFANSQRLSETHLTPHQTWDLAESPARLLKRSSSFINRPPGGKCYNCGHSQTFFEEYESPCDHGFFNRGDLEDPLVAECVQRGMDNTISFITEFVLSDWKLKIDIVEH